MNDLSVESNQKQSAAQKAGYYPETEIENSEGNLTPIEPSEVSTKGNFWDRAGLRTTAIIGFVFVGVAIFAAMAVTLTTTIGSNKKAAPKTAVQPRQVEEEKEDIGALKTNSAIGSQKAELQKLNSAILATPTPTVTPTLTPTSTPTSKPTLQPNTASVPKVAPVTIQSTPASRYEPVRAYPATSAINANKPASVSQLQKAVKPSEKIKTVYPTAPIQPKSQIQVARKQSAQFSAESSKPSDSTSADPNTAWQAAASAGTYTASEEGDKNQVAETEGQKSTTVSSKSGGEHSRSLIVGTRARGTLETTITWTGNSNYQQSYLIKLTEALQNADGTIAIPKEALIVTRIKSVAPEGWLEMSATSIVISSKEGVVEKPVPEDTMLVQAENGNPLKADYKTLSGSKDDTEATDSANSRWNALTSALKRKSKEANNQKIKPDSVPTLRILTLNKGASVQIYVNRSFGL